MAPLISMCLFYQYVFCVFIESETYSFIAHTRIRTLAQSACSIPLVHQGNCSFIIFLLLCSGHSFFVALVIRLFRFLIVFVALVFGLCNCSSGCTIPFILLCLNRPYRKL